MGLMRVRRFLFLTVALASLGILVPIGDASAQAFGRNQVQYDDFDFRVLETEHFDIYYNEDHPEAAEVSGQMLERWYARLARMLDHDLRGRQPVVLYASHPHFRQTNTTGSVGESTQGLTELLKRRIVLPMLGPLGESEHVLGHELVHAFQFDVTGQGPGSVGLDVPVAIRLPLWFIEGMSEYLTYGSESPFKSMWVRGALEADELPSFGDLQNPRYFPYHFGHAFWAYIGGRYGDDAIGTILKRAGRTGDLRRAITRTVGVPPDTLVQDWHEAIEEHNVPILEATHPPEEYASRLVHTDEGASDISMAPSLSPDGSEVVFSSERDRFSVELFLADAETGEVKRKLTQTALDPHFESLQYLDSSGAWAPDGDRFALAAISQGDPVLSVLDVRSGQTLREIRFEDGDLGEIFNPTWSPDGRRVAFSAQVDGFMDLYVVNLETEELRRLTDDRYAQLHPAWSPDGSRIAISTDAFGTDLDMLTFGDYRLALVDPESGEIEAVPGFERGKHINPQWSPDGRDLFFLSDQSGIIDLYRVELGTGELHQITHLRTGVSGISELSPALSVARETGEAVFSVHGEGNFVFNLFRMDDPDVLAGEPVTEGPGRLAGLEPASLVPAERPLDLVGRLLADERLGLADPAAFATEDYSSTLSLDFIGQPQLAAGGDQFGFFIGGGGSAFFSDMLGNKNLATQIQISNLGGEVLNSSALIASFTNESSRWNWGLTGGQSPIITQTFGFGRAETGDGQPVTVLEERRFFEINRSLQGVAQYPFNRFQRVEFSGGFRNVDFAGQTRQLFLDAAGRVIAEAEQPSPFDTIPSLNLAHATGALVYDNSIFGGTGPVLGQRYRLQVSPNLGNIGYYTVMADYRRYLMPLEPLTLAGRLLHFGRYGGDSDDFRLRNFYLGFPSLVRGYQFGSFDFAAQSGNVPVFEQLFGNRIGVANAELRLPFLGPLGVVPSAGVPPVTALAFFDAGAAWTREEDPTFLGGDRQIVRSVGVGARVNLFGLALVELDYVNPIDRDDRDWFVEFSLVPGF